MKSLRTSLLLLLLGMGAPGIASAQTQQSQQRVPPFPLGELISLLEGKLATEQILREIGAACLGFSFSANEARIQRAGADAALQTALREKCSRVEVTTQRDGTLNIVGELPRNWTRAVNRIPPNTVRTITLTPGRQATVVVTAPGWCADTLVLTMQPAESRNWTPALRARPWVGGC